MPLTSQNGRLPRLPDTGRSIGGGVTSILRAAIIDGRLGPGDRLGQDELCAELGVSQAPVREAFRSLEAEGLVEHRPNRGVFVLGLSRDELLEVVAPTRVLLECYAISQLLDTRAAEYVEALEGIIGAMEKAAADGDIDEVNDLDVAFHDVAILMCGEPHTTQLWRSIMPRLRAEFTRLAHTHSMNDIIDEHRTMLAAIRKGNRKAIRAAIHDHAVTTTRMLLDASD